MLSVKIRNTALSILFALIVFAGTAVFTDVNSHWYMALDKPAFLPPPIIFAGLWILVFVLFSVSFTLYSAKEKPADLVLRLYMLCGVLNPFWAYIFFSGHILCSLMLIIAMFILNITLYKKTYGIDNKSPFLILPNIFWLAFCVYLNYELAFLN